MLRVFSPVLAGARKNGNKSSFPMTSITETIVNGFFTMDRKWTVTYWNKAAEKLLGVAASDIVGKNLWERFAGIMPLEFYAAYPKAFLLDIPFHFEEYWGEMGSWFDVIVYHCDDTLSISFKSSNHQVPPDHPDHPEQRLKIQNELYRFVAEVSNDCLWEWNLHTNEIFWIDGGHKKVFGYDIQNAFIPHAFWESRIHPADRGRVLEGLTHAVNALTDERLWEDDYRFLRADGTYAYVHDKGYLICDDDKGPSRMIGSTLDVTNAKLTEIKLERTEKKLMRITNNSITGMAYRVQKPLANITLSTEMLDSLVKENGLHMFLDVIMRSSIRIDELMEELSKYRKENEGNDD